MADIELESFKTNIDLRAYAAAQGYELDRLVPVPWAGAFMFLFGAYMVVFPEHYRKVSARSTRR